MESEHNNESLLRSVESLAAYLKVGLSGFQSTVSLLMIAPPLNIYLLPPPPEHLPQTIPTKDP